MAASIVHIVLEHDEQLVVGQRGAEVFIDVDLQYWDKLFELVLSHHLNDRHNCLEHTEEMPVFNVVVCL